MALVDAYIPARWYTRVDDPARSIEVIVIHDMEAPEKGETAEAVARYFQGLPSTNKASAHYNVDNNTIVRCVQDKDVAYHAPGCNHNGIGIEHAGYASQTRGAWLDQYGLQMLDRSAKLSAHLCKRYGIPARFVGVDGLKRGLRGITTHAAVSEAFRRSSHYDPGRNFPMDWYIERVRFYLAGGEEEPMLSKEEAQELKALAIKQVDTGEGPGPLSEEKLYVFWQLAQAYEAGKKAAGTAELLSRLSQIHTLSEVAK